MTDLPRKAKPGKCACVGRLCPLIAWCRTRLVTSCQDAHRVWQGVRSRRGASLPDWCRLPSHPVAHPFHLMNYPFPTLSPQEAAALVQDKDTIGFGGFTAAGACKVIP